ncbi:hypothetical protein AB0F03_09660, partial [Streptomyces sp. NPDC028722]|uniref:hypothetical protein n=1 Tax=Streptomyces sp. NPDC028722 TaxID=3155016 RepID=UPI00340E03BF
MTTETLMVSSEQAHFFVMCSAQETGNGRCLRTNTVNASINGQALGLLVPVTSTRYRASRSG